MEDREAIAAHSAGSGFHAATGNHTVAAPANMIGRLTVTLVEAKLAKNYGLSRMDPYCRVRVGHSVYETPTCANGSKEPKWNKTFNCFLLRGIKNLDVEIYDECTFSQDTLIAHGSFPLPKQVISANQVCDQWFQLSGSEGEGKEGMIHIILSLQPIAPGAPLAAAMQVHRTPAASVSQKTAYLPEHPGQQEQYHQHSTHRPNLSEEELEDFLKMFPNLDREIITSVFMASGGDKEAMVNNLLGMGQEE